MRGLVKAAAFLTPALVQALVVDYNLLSPISLVTLKVPVGDEASSHAVRLLFDVEQTGEVCGPSGLSINGQYLSQDITGSGSGVLSVEDGAIITAKWSFTCNPGWDRDANDQTLPSSQTVSLTITSLDGQSVNDAVISAQFRQVEPVVMAQVEGPTVVRQLYLSEDDERVKELRVKEHHRTEQDGFDHSVDNFLETDLDDKFFSDMWQGTDGVDLDDDVKALVKELQDLRQKAYELDQLLYAKAGDLIDRLQDGHPFLRLPPAPPTPAPIEDCHNIGCVVNHLTAKFRKFVLKKGHHRHHRGCHRFDGSGRGRGRPHCCEPCHGRRPSCDASESGLPNSFHHSPSDRDHEPTLTDLSPSDVSPQNIRPTSHVDNELKDTVAEGIDIIEVSSDDASERPMQFPSGDYASYESLSSDSATPSYKPALDGEIFGPLALWILDEPFLAFMGIGAILFGISALCGLRALHKQVSSRSRGSRQAHRTRTRGRRHETREERRARRENRKQAVKDFFSRLFGSIFNKENEQKETERESAGVVGDRAPSDNTMEQDIAELRQAVTMVDQLVAAEEGRTRESSMIEQFQSPPLLPDSVRQYYPGFATPEEEPLPEYREYECDASTVADGFRYSPGSSGDLPSHLPIDASSTGSSSDRLGYNK